MSELWHSFLLSSKQTNAAQSTKRLMLVIRVHGITSIIGTIYHCNGVRSQPRVISLCVLLEACNKKHAFES